MPNAVVIDDTSANAYHQPMGGQSTGCDGEVDEDVGEGLVSCRPRCFGNDSQAPACEQPVNMCRWVGIVMTQPDAVRTL